MQSQNLYFLAVVPNGKVAGEVTAFKEHIALHYNSLRALRVMPHITLKAPFTIAQHLQNEVLRWFSRLNLKTAPFTVSLNGFGAFANAHNPVIYVKPVTSAALRQLQQEVIENFKPAFPQIALHETEKVFSPHMTIAYRDLTFDMFEKAWAKFKDRPYQGAFDVTSVCLLQHDGHKWHVVAEKALQ